MRASVRPPRASLATTVGSADTFKLGSRASIVLSSGCNRSEWVRRAAERSTTDNQVKEGGAAEALGRAGGLGMKGLDLIYRIKSGVPHDYVGR